MAEKNFKRYLPSFITIVFELMEHWKRDAAHNSNIKKLDKTTEQLGTIENMLVRLEKKIQYNRDLVSRLSFLLYISIAANLVFFALILLKVFTLI